MIKEDQLVLKKGILFHASDKLCTFWPIRRSEPYAFLFSAPAAIFLCDEPKKGKALRKLYF